jgi:hypothetical protein
LPTCPFLSYFFPSVFLILQSHPPTFSLGVLFLIHNHKGTNIPELKVHDSHAWECSWLMFWTSDTIQKVVLLPSLDDNAQYPYSTEPLTTNNPKPQTPSVWH